MESILSTLAFALLIGAQFLAAIVLNSKRQAIYGERPSPKGAERLPAEQRQSAAAMDEQLPAKAA
jgi:hypothetical protein